MVLMSTAENDARNRGKQQQKVQTIAKTESIISSQVFYNRRNEIYEYLKLFGYKPDKTIIQVHITGFFHKKGQQQSSQKERERTAAAIKRYGGTSFVVVGRTHDPVIMENIVKPKRKNTVDNSPGYMGYLWKNKDPQKRDPHEVIPLDFTPIHLPYPSDWKNMFSTKGFLLALHVPSSFAKGKNRLTRALYHVAKKSSAIDIRKEWTFLNDIMQYGFKSNDMRQEEQEKEQKQQPQQMIATAGIPKAKYPQQHPSKSNNVLKGKSDINNDDDGDPITIIKRRLAKGKIGKKEYGELKKAIKS
jgi:hypothetical protein